MTERVHNYEPTADSVLLRQASLLDPLGLNEYAPGVPEAITAGHTEYLAAPLKLMAEMAVGKSIENLTNPELIATIRDGDFALMVALRACDIRGVDGSDLLDRFPGTEQALIKIAQRQNQGTNRANINAFLAQSPGHRSFTGLASEAHFQISIMEAYFANDFAVELLGGSDFSNDSFETHLGRLQKTALAFDVMRFSNQHIENEVVHEEFSMQIQPCFRPLPIAGIETNSQGATQLPIRLAEEMLRGIDPSEQHAAYMKLQAEAYPHLTAAQRNIYQQFTERNGMSYEAFLFGGKSQFVGDELEALQNGLDTILNVIDTWRARHLYIVSQSFKARPEGSIGSSGGDLDWLLDIHKAQRLRGGRSARPAPIGTIACKQRISQGRSRNKGLVFHNLYQAA